MFAEHGELRTDAELAFIRTLSDVTQFVKRVTLR